jgi:hypothetical protein
VPLARLILVVTVKERRGGDRFQHGERRFPFAWRVDDHFLHTHSPTAEKSSVRFTYAPACRVSCWCAQLLVTTRFYCRLQGHKLILRCGALNSMASLACRQFLYVLPCNARSTRRTSVASVRPGQQRTKHRERERGCGTIHMVQTAVVPNLTCL